MPVLYIVATPIGNLEDITLRALRVLQEVHLIAAEDTRTARKLLTRYNIKTRLTSYFEHNKRTKLQSLLDTLESNDVALISEAGTPGISDPGYELIKEAIANNIEVVAVPGSSAVITAIAVSGLPTDQFVYVGFLPRKKSERKLLLRSLISEPRTIVCFESPYRVLAALNEMGDILGERRIAVCRELTKMHEEVFRGTIGQAVQHFNKPRGEFTLVIEGTGDIKKSLRRAREKFISGD
ncbi:MAG: 16S rRNA (cytidine(1402)-2'-O)-methyltransferase [Chloroflexi bacterium]|nr:16S rRNA (cytidine(1402)-2'-O)-methyltransferase [Chloroflexota bacterium]